VTASSDRHRLRALATPATAIVAGTGLAFIGSLRADLWWIAVWGAITLLLAPRERWAPLAWLAICSGGVMGLLLLLYDYLGHVLNGEPLHRSHQEWMVRGGAYAALALVGWSAGRRALTKERRAVR
jgi:hypothetical protein